MDCGDPTPPDDPWVRISDCIKTLFSPAMSERPSRGEDRVQGPPPKPTAAASATASSTEKKGPPVAPKPAWFRQTLKSLRGRALDSRPLPEGTSPEPPAPLERQGPPVKAAASIRQKISSFETFSSLKLPGREAQSLKPQTPSLVVAQVPTKALKPPPGPVGTSNTCPPWRSAPHCSGHPCGQPAPPPEPDSPEKSAPHCSEHPRGQPALFHESDSSEGLVSQGTKACPEPWAKRPSQRAHSFPLASTSAREEAPSQLYGLSSQVSSAVLRSLLSCLLTTSTSSPNEDPGTLSSAKEPALDSGFSFNLLELWDSQEELAGPTEAEEGTPCSLKPGQSRRSLLSPEELRTMMEEVKTLDKAALEELEHVRVTVLHKAVGAGLGFSLAGGADLESKLVTVHRVFPDGLAAQEGTIERGSEVLSINGKSLKGATHQDALAVLRQARGPPQAVVVTRKLEHQPPTVPIQPEEPAEGNVITVTLTKAAGGLGFSLEGGQGSLHGDRPLTINRIFQGAATTGTTKESLQPGDEVLALAGTPAQGLSRFEAWKIIKALPDGPVTIVVRRACGADKAALAGDPH